MLGLLLADVLQHGRASVFIITLAMRGRPHRTRTCTRMHTPSRKTMNEICMMTVEWPVVTCTRHALLIDSIKMPARGHHLNLHIKYKRNTSRAVWIIFATGERLSVKVSPLLLVIVTSEPSRHPGGIRGLFHYPKLINLVHTWGFSNFVRVIMSVSQLDMH